MPVGTEAALIEASQSLSRLGITAPQPLSLFTFFKSLDGGFAVLRALGAFDESDELKRHIDYLASKAGCRPALIFGGEPFSVDRRIILEALVNITGTLCTALTKQAGEAPEGIPHMVFAMIRAAESALEGKCSRAKALFLAQLILTEQPRSCVEIGVLGGRSIVPCAATLRHVGTGFITCVGTWGPDSAPRRQTPGQQNDDTPERWWSRTDFPRIKRQFHRFVAAADLTQQVRLVEVEAAPAVTLFDQIDFLHVNGSQCVDNAAEVAVLYACKVRRGGIVLLDEVDWTGAESAWENLRGLYDAMAMPKPPPGMEHCAILRRRGRSDPIDFADLHLAAAQ